MDKSHPLYKIRLPQELRGIYDRKDIEVIVPESRDELLALAMGGADNESYDVSYEVAGRGLVREVVLSRCKNGVVANYDDLYMRRRDPDCMVIADNFPTDKTTHEERFGKPFGDIREEALAWLLSQKKLLIMPFMSGNETVHLGYASLLVIPANAAFFAAALADLQGFIPASQLPNAFRPKTIVYVAPPFRHLHYEGKQVVIHNRNYNDKHEIFSFNLYPGPSAKKGIYGVLLNIGEEEDWVTLHASTVQVITPYELMFTILHEGASGGGKSEMIQAFHRQNDGRLLLAENTVTDEKIILSIMEASELHPVTDDMALAHPALNVNNSNKLVVADAENAWFLRVNHITAYGTEPETEALTIAPPQPLIFLNMDAKPGATCLIWEPVMDVDAEKGTEKPCPNPRVIMPRDMFANHVDGPVEVDVRSFGFRTPPCTRENPSYGIAGVFHVLPPALAWLWRLVSPRGHDNPSIVDDGEMVSEGVGSYWPFATGKRVDQANLLLNQIQRTLSTRYVLIPNQHIGAYKVGFCAQWIAREYLARRGGMKFREGALQESRCPLLGYALDNMKVDGQPIPKILLQVNHQPEVGNSGYDAGAKILTTFFKNEIRQYLKQNIQPLGKRIIEACLNDARVVDYYNFIPKL